MQYESLAECNGKTQTLPVRVMRTELERFIVVLNFY